MAPPQVSAEILMKMKEAVITVPAYFNDSQRQATKDAGKIAGLEVLSTNGDTFLGGEDFDMRLIEHLVVKLSRAKLESLVEDLVGRSMDPVKAALKDASLSPSDIDHVILVGGQTRMPMVQKVVADYFGKEPRKDVNPDEAVAMGAAIQGGVLAGDNKSLGRFDLTDIPPSPRGMPQIEVTFDLDANGILNVSAKDKATNKEQTIRITACGGLSDEDIEGMIADAEANADADAKFEEMVVARNTCEGLVNASKKTLEEAGEHATDEEKAAIEAAISEAEEALKGDDKEAIDAAAAKLTEATSSVAQKMYAAQAESAEGAQAAEPEQGEPSADEDVMDAEFEEVKDDQK
ncbi:UNVERIFIED_CONTAM: hypothetical protein GTU68_047286 [Idotea baltica]|nr:hypothetical protein [Idotea baltica]